MAPPSTPEPLLRQIQEKLQAQKSTVATAESCTGGLVATWLTHLAGSSAVYLGGVSAYDNRVKTGLLGVPEALLAAHGAVSAPVAEAMAAGARARIGTTYAVAVTGIAGPSGGTPEKPVGTVFLGLASPAGTRSRRLALPGDRSGIRAAAAEAALAELLTELSRGPAASDNRP